MLRKSKKHNINFPSFVFSAIFTFFFNFLFNAKFLTLPHAIFVLFCHFHYFWPYCLDYVFLPSLLVFVIADVNNARSLKVEAWTDQNENQNNGVQFELPPNRKNIVLFQNRITIQSNLFFATQFRFFLFDFKDTGFDSAHKE